MESMSFVGRKPLLDYDVRQLARRRQPGDLGAQRVGVDHLGDHLVARGGQQPRQALAQQDGVIGEQDPMNSRSGISALMRHSMAWSFSVMLSCGGSASPWVSSAILLSDGNAGLRLRLS